MRDCLLPFHETFNKKKTGHKNQKTRMKDKSHGSDLWLGILLKREGITMAHIIIIVDHLGKGSSLPIAGSKINHKGEKQI